MRHPLIEIAVDSLPDALAAADAGANRLELCTDLASHGVSALPRTLADFRVASMIPVAAMVRPRGGDFVASPSDHFLAPRQTEALLAAGADAIVFGFLTPDRRVDVELCRRMVRTAGGIPTVFHRAFDLIDHPFDALDQLIDLGVKRVLTAGMSPPTAAHALGLPCGPYIPDSFDGRLLALRRYADRAAGRIEILPCGGVRAENVQRFISEAGASQVHSACRAPGADRVDAQQVRDLVGAVRAMQSRKA